VQLDPLVEVAQVVDVTRDDRSAFSTRREDDGRVDYIRGLSLAAEDTNGFGQDLIQRYDRRRRCSREGPKRDLLRRIPPNLSQNTSWNDDPSARIERFPNQSTHPGITPFEGNERPRVQDHRPRWCLTLAYDFRTRLAHALADLLGNPCSASMASRIVFSSSRRSF
jgi:hypothetical protein